MATGPRTNPVSDWEDVAPVKAAPTDWEDVNDWQDVKAIDYNKPAEPSNLQKLGTGVKDFTAGIGAGALSTGVGAYNLARKTPVIGKALPKPNAYVEGLTQPAQSTAGRAGKMVEQTAEFFVPGGMINRGAKAIEGLTAGSRIAPAVNALGRAGLEAGSAAGVTGVQTGGDIPQMKQAAMTAGTVSAATPLIAGAVRKVTPAILGKTTGAGEESIRIASTNPSPAFMKAMRGGTDEGDIVGAFKEALGNVKEARGATYRQQLAALPQQQFPPTVLDPVRQELAAKLQAFRVRTLPSGELDFSRSVIPNSERATVEQIASDVNGWDDLTPLGLDALKRRISNYYSPTSDVRALTSTVENATKRTLHMNVPGYSQMTQDYALASDFIKKVEQEMALGPRAQQGTAIRRISYALKQNNEYRKVLTEALDNWTSSDLQGQLAGYHLKDTLPKGITGVGSGLGILGAIASGSLPASYAAAMMASSPRITGEVLAAMSKMQGLGPSISGAAPKIAASASVNRAPTSGPPALPQFSRGGVVGPPPMPKQKQHGPPPMPRK